MDAVDRVVDVTLAFTRLLDADNHSVVSKADQNDATFGIGECHHCFSQLVRGNTLPELDVLRRMP